MLNRSSLLASAVASGCLFMFSAVASAAVITVDTTNDELDNEVGNGNCSLREAVQAVNNQSAVDNCPAGDGNDTITFAATLADSTIVLDMAGPREDFNASGDLDIRLNTSGGTGGSLTIMGPGTEPNSIVIDGARLADVTEADRVFHVIGNSFSTQTANFNRVEFANLTVQNGQIAPGPQDFDIGGAGILIEMEGEVTTQLGTLALQNIRVANNVLRNDFTAGGGVLVDTVDTLDIDDSMFTANSVEAAGQGEGGGIFVQQAQTVQIDTSQFSNNMVTASQGEAVGGGLALNTVQGAATIGQSLFVDNQLTASNGNQDFSPRVMGGGLSARSVGQMLSLTGVQIDRNTITANRENAETSSDPRSSSAMGGGLFGGSLSGVTVSGSSFDDNTGIARDGNARGGGFFIDFAANLEMDQSSADTNTLMAMTDQNDLGGNARGGGFWISDLNEGTGTLDITNSSLSNNDLSASRSSIAIAGGNADGGGSFVPSAGSATVDNTQYMNNTLNAPGRSTGGGFWLNSVGLTLEFTNSSFSGNSITAGSALGGGIYFGGASQQPNPGALNMSATAVIDNVLTATESDANGAGLWSSAAGLLAIDRSEFSGNMATTEAAAPSDGPTPTAFGGGLYIDGQACPSGQSGPSPCMQIRNSTISGNNLAAPNNRAAGAGLFLLTTFIDSIAQLNNVTIANNGVMANDASGGGFAVADAAELRLSNTLVADNTADAGPDCIATQSGGEVMQDGVIVSNDYNLIGIDGACAFPAATNDLVGNPSEPIDPLLGPLGDNGGPTRTHNLEPGSPALDGGNPADPTGMNGTCQTTDQRGQPRPRDGDGNGSAECDIGALEREANAPPTIVDAIPDQTLQSNDEAVTFNLNTVFSDPEDGPLTFEAVSSNPSLVIASVDGNILTIDPIADGEVTVDVTATDEFGAEATDSPTVTVANQPPVIDNAIQDQGLSANGSSEMIDLSAVFSDPENDPLTFEATSNNVEVVMVSIDGNTLTLSPGQVGNTTVDVTATDDLGANVTDTFNVEVSQDNLPPNIVSPIPDQILRVDDQPVTFDLTDVFSDPEEAQLTFSAVSSNSEIATATVDGDTLTISPVSVGNVMVDVTASDPMEASATDTVLVEVNMTNRAPTVVASIPDQTLSADGNANIDLNQFFQDPDGDPLFFSATSSNPDVVAVSVDNEGILTLTAGSPGTATITVTAQDEFGGEAFQRVSISDSSGGGLEATSGGGGCALSADARQPLDPSLWLLVLSAVWWLSRRRQRD